MCGTPQRVQTVWSPENVELMQYEVARKGVLPFLDPLPRFEVTQPGNILRILSRGAASGQRSASPSGPKSPAGRERG
jgi:hypothetical protein